MTMRVFKVMMLGLLVASFMLLPSMALATGQTLVYGSTEKLDDLDPHTMYTINGIEVLSQVHAMLLNFKPGTLELIPDLALSYTANDDNTEWTFKLRQGLAWPDGTPFNAEVVKHSVERVVALEGPPAFLVTDYVDHVEVIDEYTVKFVLKAPLGFFPYMLPHSVFMPLNPNEYTMEKAANWPSDLPGGRMMGLGQYFISSFKRDEEIIFEANPDYYGEQPKNDRIVLQTFADATTMRLALEKGELDFAYKNLNPVDIDDLAKSGKYNVYEMDAPYFRYICFQTQTEPFNNANLRRALAMATDRQPICDKIFFGQMAPSYSFMAKAWFPYIDAFKDEYGAGADLAKAKELLAAEGYNESNKLQVDFWYTPSTFGDTEIDLATMLKAQWEATGVMDVKVHSVEWAGFIDKFSAKKDMPAYLLAWYPDYVDPDNLMALGSGGGSAALGMDYNDEAFNAKLAEAREVTDIAKRTELYHWLQKSWAKSVPVLPLTQGNLYTIAQKNIKGHAYLPIGTIWFSGMYRE
ncbi:MAG: peptide ABC transporter substrate-binding protein [Deltaproteobacteria bacterium]|nr:peptide ABC transporter substrate-binding protein [Deltaproteobacteria bacterium]